VPSEADAALGLKRATADLADQGVRHRAAHQSAFQEAWQLAQQWLATGDFIIRINFTVFMAVYDDWVVY